MWSSDKKKRICIIPRHFFFRPTDSLGGACMRANARRHVSSAILFPFPFIAALPSLFAEHQHHLLFARSIYSVNYICLCSRYTAVMLPSVNCAFTFFPPSPLLLFIFLFTPFSVCSFFSFLSYRSQFGIPRGLRFHMISHAGSPPADWLCQTFAGPLEAGSKFSIRTTFLA